jgi:hypothetical protein
VLFVFVAVAPDSTEFDCLTEPSLPGLRTRTGVFTFFAPVCVAVETAPAACRLPADCFAIWMSVGPLQPHGLEPPVGSCEDDWFVELVFDASAVELAEFDWLTEPLSPGLSTRTSMFEFVGSTCLAEEAAPASWAFPADWSEVWTLPPDPLVVVVGVAPTDGTVEAGAQPQELPPDCDWSLDWSVEFVFVELAVEPAVFDWVTAPFEPGLSTRTGMFWLLAPTWFALESAAATWPFRADWFAVWTPLPDWLWLES